MAEKRMIARAVSQSRKLSKVSLKAALVWTWAIPWFDGYGFIEAEPDFLKLNIVPRREDISEEDIPEIVKEISEAGLWKVYRDKNSGKVIAFDPKFNDYQNIRIEREGKQKLFPGDPYCFGKRKPLKKDVWFSIWDAWEKSDHVCPVCKKQGVKEGGQFYVEGYIPFEIDHIIPLVKGGTDEISNLQVICRRCNRQKGGNSGTTQDYSSTYPAEDKIDEVKLSEVKIEKQQERPPSLLPTIEEKKELSSLCVQVNSKCGMKFNSFAWIQKNIGLNPQTHIHVLRRLLETKDIRNPWGLADQIASIEDGNYNEKDHISESERHKIEPGQVGNIFKNLGVKI